MDNDRDLLLVSVFTFFTVLLWISFELIKTTKTTTVTAPVRQIVTPLSSTIDTQIIFQLKERKTY
ncbi:hypothetical protein HY339_00250 [Candidatus Gottesmanbacteria bacterium]|nr:hypothetical protein [Candidatus Gottesmanbacteria bacterium]